jgi:hypothetical protein
MNARVMKKFWCKVKRKRFLLYPGPLRMAPAMPDRWRLFGFSLPNLRFLDKNSLLQIVNR